MNTHDIDSYLDIKRNLPALPPSIPASFYSPVTEYAAQAIEADRKRRGEPVGYIMPTALKQLKAGGNAIVGGVSQGCDVPIYTAPQPAEPSRGDPDTEREKWLASLFPEDRMFEEIDQMARESYKRHMSLKRGQMVVRADAWESHVIWATKRWIEINEPAPRPQPAEPVKVPSDDLAHEIWAAAQTAPGEGIEDAVERVAALLARYTTTKEQP